MEVVSLLNPFKKIFQSVKLKNAIMDKALDKFHDKLSDALADIIEEILKASAQLLAALAQGNFSPDMIENLLAFVAERAQNFIDALEKIIDTLSDIKSLPDAIDSIKNMSQLRDLVLCIVDFLIELLGKSEGEETPDSSEGPLDDISHAIADYLADIAVELIRKVLLKGEGGDAPDDPSFEPTKEKAKNKKKENKSKKDKNNNSSSDALDGTENKDADDASSEPSKEKDKKKKKRNKSKDGSTEASDDELSEGTKKKDKKKKKKKDKTDDAASGVSDDDSDSENGKKKKNTCVGLSRMFSK